MALVVVQPDLLTVQNIIDTVSQDLRYQISSTTLPDQNILLDYCNRTQMVLLRTSRWEFLLSPPYGFTTQVGVTDYYIGVNGKPSGAFDTGLAIANIGSIKRSSVYDQTNFLPLAPITEPPVSQSLEQQQRPRFYRNDEANLDVINIYPPPDGNYLVTFRVYAKPLQLTDVGQLVQVPIKYKDVLIAGTNEKGFVYLKKADEVQYWADEFKQGKTSIIRDQNLFPRGAEFNSPDPTTQKSISTGDDFFNTLYNGLKN